MIWLKVKEEASKMKLDAGKELSKINLEKIKASK